MSCPACRNLDRRTFLGLLGLGAAAALAGCRPADTNTAATVTTGATTSTTTAIPTDIPTTTATSPVGPAAPPDLGTAPTVVFGGPPAAVAARQIAITIDDGYCAECATAYVELAQQTGLHLTFNPNGRYHDVWQPLATTLRPLVEAGQVQIGNHTYDHLDMRELSDSRATAQLERNEEWVQATFGTSTRPWWRPPYGFHDERTDALAASLGYAAVLMWNGSYGDSRLLTPDVLLTQARRYLQPGTIMLGHANHPTVTHLFPEIAAIIRDRDLHPVTLNELFAGDR